MNQNKRLFAVLLCCLLLLTAIGSIGAAQGRVSPGNSSRNTEYSFGNTTGLAIIDLDTTNGQQPTTPDYPSVVTVSGVQGIILDVYVLVELSHQFVGDVDMLLADPQGNSVMLMSDVWEGGPVDGIVGLKDGNSPIPGTATNGNDPLPLGSFYAPTNIANANECPGSLGADAFPAPAPTGTVFATFAQAFTGADASFGTNGDWKLYITDDCNQDSGSVVGWTLFIDTDFTPTATPTDVPVETATPTDVPVETATPTETPVPEPVFIAELDTNGSFEDETGASSIDGWKVTNSIGDKVKCNKDGKPAVALYGNCAFRFKVTAPDKTVLSQKANLAGWTPALGQSIVLAYGIMKPGDYPIYLGVTGKIVYSDETPKTKFSFDSLDFEDNLEPGVYLEKTTYNNGGTPLESAAVKSIKLKFYLYEDNTKGKVYIDGVYLAAYDFTGVGGALLPLPQNSFSISGRK